MKILGISAFYHDSAAALIKDGQVVFAAQEERFSRRKYDAAFPEQAIRFCLEAGDIPVEELDAVVFYDKPFLKFERILETYYEVAPRGFPSFLKSMPAWLGEKLFIKQTLRRELRKVAGKKSALPALYFPEHHLSHTAGAYYPSGFEHALILTVDGVGEYTTTSICEGKGSQIKRLRTIAFPDSLGLLYAAFTYYLGFRVNAGEYKVMGLAPYGNTDSSQYLDFYRKTVTELIDIRPDGSFRLNQRYFTYRSGLRMTHDRRWARLFGFPRRRPEEPLAEHHHNLALAVQRIAEDVLLKLAREGQRLTQASNLCLSGGVALNCVANGRLQRSELFNRIYVQPAAGDAGGAEGSALALYHLMNPGAGLDHAMPTAYLGPEPGELPVLPDGLKRTSYAETEELAVAVSEHLARGQVGGWVQDRMEFGPRALGNRSILADPRRPGMKDHLNQIIKEREIFRPFAPVVLEEDAGKYFEMGKVKTSPYMLFTYPVISPDIPAVTHVDGSARVQTVSRTQNEKLHNLLRAFRDRTGCSVLLNTSFNGKNEPIVSSAADALNCFLKTGIDILVIGNTLIER